MCIYYLYNNGRRVLVDSLNSASDNDDVTLSEKNVCKLYFK